MECGRWAAEQLITHYKPTQCAARKQFKNSFLLFHWIVFCGFLALGLPPLICLPLLSFLVCLLFAEHWLASQPITHKSKTRRKQRKTNSNYGGATPRFMLHEDKNSTQFKDKFHLSFHFVSFFLHSAYAWAAEGRSNQHFFIQLIRKSRMKRNDWFADGPAVLSLHPFNSIYLFFHYWFHSHSINNKKR